MNGGADISLHGLFGDFPSVRLSVMGGLVIPLPAGLSAALEAGGANIRGDPAPEEVWRLGGSGEWLRGYPRVVLRGSEVWRSRAELQRKISLLAVSVFHDWASVDGSSLQSAGVGVSVFNGFLRADLARPLSPWYEEESPSRGARTRVLTRRISPGGSGTCALWRRSEEDPRTFRVIFRSARRTLQTRPHG